MVKEDRPEIQALGIGSIGMSWRLRRPFSASCKGAPMPAGGTLVEMEMKTAVVSGPLECPPSLFLN